jgi:hypothetical protein
MAHQKQNYKKHYFRNSFVRSMNFISWNISDLLVVSVLWQHCHVWTQVTSSVSIIDGHLSFI